MNASSESEKLFYNAVWNAVGCNHREISKLKSAADTWEDVFKKFNKTESLDPETEWMKLEKSGVRLIFSEEPDFPELLREIYWPPFGLYVKGEIEFLKNPTVAIVGTRKATGESLEVARRFGGEFAKAGITVVSGLAFGIDSRAHKGCLDASGKTVAVLARGLDGIYPKSNERLAGEILFAGGALISEYPPGVPPLRP